MSKPIPLSLTPQFDNRSSAVSKDAKLVNGYVEGVTKEKVYTIKRPGFDSGTLYEAGDIQGVTTYLGVARVVVNNKFFKTSTTSAVIDAGDAIVEFL